jgi:hypothetical protein
MLKSASQEWCNVYDADVVVFPWPGQMARNASALAGNPNARIIPGHPDRPDAPQWT